MKTVKFRQMKEGDREDYAFLTAHEIRHASHTAERLLRALEALDESLSGYQVTRLEHSLQTATRAWWDGADLDWIVSALLHDIGDIYAPYNHDEFAAAVLRPFVREQCAWCVQTHGDFQLVYYAKHVGADPRKRERWRDSPYFDDCAEFCDRWDQSSFDPDYENLDTGFFRPMVETVFARRPHDPEVIRSGVRVPLTDPEAAMARRVDTSRPALRP